MRLYAIATGTGAADISCFRAVKSYATAAGTAKGDSDELRSLGAVKSYATQSTDVGDTTTLRSVKAYASHGPGVSDKRQAYEDVREETGYPHILISYVYDTDRKFADRLGYDPADWLGDSGAFTAWTMGTDVDLADLIEWCRYQVERSAAFQCISLDVIPGEAGGDRRPTTRERNRAMRQSLENGDAMRAAGLKIIEVFHVYEPLSHLDKLIERRQPGELLGLGGMVGRSEGVKRAFADEVFRRVRDRAGGWQDIVPVHGLGISVRSPIAARYPWFSVDSSSWLAPAQYGKKVNAYGALYGDDERTRHKSVRHLYLVRALEGWLKQEAALTKMWAERGVTFAL